jgi:hypothetical protein
MYTNKITLTRVARFGLPRLRENLCQCEILANNRNTFGYTWRKIAIKEEFPTVIHSPYAHSDSASSFNENCLAISVI